MREILFRGKDANSNEWRIGYFYTAVQGCVAIIGDGVDGYQVKPETVGQYTGLCDKNGTKIFEHDIVRIAVCGTYDNYVISYDIENARFVVGDTGFTFWSYISTKIEVIGNIHDNPELIGGA